MDDAQIHTMIEAARRRGAPPLGRPGPRRRHRGRQARLAEVKVSLDRCWDLLRQRRSYEEKGLDPDAAQARDESVVENYLQ